MTLQRKQSSSEKYEWFRAEGDIPIAVVKWATYFWPSWYVHFGAELEESSALFVCFFVSNFCKRGKPWGADGLQPDIEAG